MKEIDDIFLKNIPYVLLLINVSLYTYSYLKGNKSKAVKYLNSYLALSFCITIASYVIINFNKELNIERNNLFLSHYYFIFRFIFLSLFYGILFTKKQKHYQIIISALVFLVLIIQYSLNSGIYDKFNLLEIFITSFPLVIYSVFHLYNSLSKPGKYMYINAGVLVYISISTLVFILGNLMTTIDRSLSLDIWFLNRLLYAGYLILFIVEWKKSIWKTKN